MEPLPQLVHVLDGEGDVGDDEVVVQVDGGAALDQVEVHVAEAQPGAVAEGRRERLV